MDGGSGSDDGVMFGKFSRTLHTLQKSITQAIFAHPLKQHNYIFAIQECMLILAEDGLWVES